MDDEGQARSNERFHREVLGEAVISERVLQELAALVAVHLEKRILPPEERAFVTRLMHEHQAKADLKRSIYKNTVVAAAIAALGGIATAMWRAVEHWIHGGGPREP